MELELTFRYFNGGRFWQIPGDSAPPGERVPDAVRRRLRGFEIESDGSGPPLPQLEPA
jgi:hypothetical protein